MIADLKRENIMKLLLLLLALSGVAQAQVQPGATEDGAAIFQRIHHLRQTRQPENSDENGFLYMMNTPANLHLRLEFFQMMPNDAQSTTLHIWVRAADAQAHPEMLGKPSPFPQMWVRYHGDDFVEAGASQVEYPTYFQINATAHPNLIYDFEDQIVKFP
jgi:hypothetical protein